MASQNPRFATARSRSARAITFRGARRAIRRGATEGSGERISGVSGRGRATGSNGEVGERGRLPHVDGVESRIARPTATDGATGVDRCGPGGQKNYVTNFALTHGCTERLGLARSLRSPRHSAALAEARPKYFARYLASRPADRGDSALARRRASHANYRAEKSARIPPGRPRNRRDKPSRKNRHE